MTLLDLDGVCCGDGARDLATAMAHLRWQGLKQPEALDVLEAAEDAFLAAYEARAGRVDRRRLRWWRAAALLQVAGRRYRRLDVADWPVTSLLVSAAEDEVGDPHPAASGRRLPDSGDLLDPRQMSGALRTALGPLATSPARVSVVAADLLSAAADRRCVVRYAVRGLDGQDPVPVIGKVFTEPQRARLLHEQLQVLSSGPFSAGRFRVPRPVALLAEPPLVLYRPGVGEPLDRIRDPASARAGVRAAAGWLAVLHGSQVQLSRRLDPAREAVSTREWADAIGRRDPDLLAPARRLASGWAHELRVAGVGDEVPLHKDFHAGHVLVSDELCVIDLDEARHGDPALDVAHFCTHLEYRGDPGRMLRDAFLLEYTAATGWHDAGSLAAWTAYTWLKIAKQLTVGSGPWRQYGSGTSRTPADAVARGLTCLDR
jgi:aminoglycoside phosphotransferase (APT) family kinase protein